VGRARDPNGTRPSFDTSGNKLQHYGQRVLDMEFESGRNCRLKVEKCEATKNILSVFQGIEEGYTFCFTPNGAWVSKEAPCKPCDLRRGDFVANRGSWYLRTCETLGSKQGQLIAPVDDDQMSNQAMEVVDQDAEEQVDEPEPLVGDLNDTEEPQQPNAVPSRQPVKPAMDVAKAHEITHLPYVAWCDVSMKSKAWGPYH
jgi:hypothetical protein